MKNTLIVKLNQNDTYRQILAMCNDGENYSLQQGDYKETELEVLTVADRKEITIEKMNTPLQGKMLGYIRLLPYNGNTLIIFVHKNRPEWYDYPVINPELWDDFITAVSEYFKSALTVDAVGAKSNSPKIPDMPTKTADAYKWVLVWERIESKIQEDPTLKIDYHELQEWLSSSSLHFKVDTLRKVIRCGQAKKIPTRVDFERMKNL